MLFRRNCKTVRVTPVVSSGAIYAAGDQIGTLMEFANVFDGSSGCCTIESIFVTDKAKQKSSIDLFFFGKQPTNAVADNAAADISDADVAAMCLGVVNVPAASYLDLANNSVACVRDIKLLVQQLDKFAAKSLWVLAVSRGTPTYTSVSDLTFGLGISQD